MFIRANRTICKGTRPAHMNKGFSFLKQVCVLNWSFHFPFHFSYSEKPVDMGGIAAGNGALEHFLCKNIIILVSMLPVSLRSASSRLKPHANSRSDFRFTSRRPVSGLT